MVCRSERTAFLPLNTVSSRGHKPHGRCYLVNARRTTAHIAESYGGAKAAKGITQQQ